MSRVRRSVHDREIVLIALPALGALAAEPLYLLADTAIVGHLGTTELAALALAATILSSLVGLCNFLAYGTTAQVARLHGAGDEAQAGSLGAQAFWLALAVGLVLASATVALAAPLIHLLGGNDAVATMAVRYLRISAIGLPCALLALSGQGWLRGVGDLRTPLIIVVVANLANVVLELLLVYGLDLGLDGSAWGTVVAQLGMGAAFAWLLLRARATTRRPVWDLMRPMTRMGAQIVVRTASLLLVFAVASAVLARTSDAALAANQIAFELFIFLALVLDALAIAGQVLVGRALGAENAADARVAGRRLVELSFLAGLGMAVVLMAFSGLIPRIFTSDQAVLDQLSLIVADAGRDDAVRGDGVRLRRHPDRCGRHRVHRDGDGAGGDPGRRDRTGGAGAGLGHRRRLVRHPRADGDTAGDHGAALRRRRLGADRCGATLDRVRQLEPVRRAAAFDL